MALDIEIERIRKDGPGWRSLTLRLFAHAHEGVLTDWELDFLQELPARPGLEELSYRQAEALLGIRDALQMVSSYRGASIKYLIRVSYEGRADLDDEDDEAFVLDLHARGVTTLRKKAASRLYRLAKRLGEVED